MGTVFFDLFDTLVTQEHPDRPAQQVFADRLGIPLDGARAWWKETVRDRMAGVFPTYEETLRQMVTSLGAVVDEAVVADICRDRFADKRSYLVDIDAEGIGVDPGDEERSARLVDRWNSLERTNPQGSPQPRLAQEGPQSVSLESRSILRSAGRKNLEILVRGCTAHLPLVELDDDRLQGPPVTTNDALNGPRARRRRPRRHRRGGGLPAAGGHVPAGRSRSRVVIALLSST